MKKSIQVHCAFTVALILVGGAVCASSLPGTVTFPELVIPGTTAPTKPVVKQITFSNLNSAGSFVEWKIFCRYKAEGTEEPIGFSVTASGNTLTGYAGYRYLNNENFESFISGIFPYEGALEWEHVAPALVNPPTFTIKNVDQQSIKLDCVADFDGRIPTEK